MDTYEWLEAYESILENEAVASNVTSDGAMSSGPILNSSLDNPKMAIYTIFKKNCDGDDCLKEFGKKSEMLKFLKDNPDWESKSE